MELERRQGLSGQRGVARPGPDLGRLTAATDVVQSPHADICGGRKWQQPFGKAWKTTDEVQRGQRDPNLNAPIDLRVGLAKPQLFRTQIAQGRGTVDIRDDIRLAVASAKATRDSASLLDLILADHELGRRSEALGDAVFDAHVALGDLDRALTYLDTGSGVTLSGERGFFLVDALLDKQRAVDAQRLPDWARRRAAWICADNGDFALAEIFLTGLDAPSLDEAANDYSEEALRGEVEEVRLPTRLLLPVQRR